MNRFLYKYMPLREEFFANPMIRATPVLALNDPFEGCFNRDQVRDADRNQRDFYKKAGKEVFDIEESELDGIMGVIQSDLSDLGVLSFTEDFNNPLMWAHYANEHKGMVIEFDFNEAFFVDSLKEINGRKSRFGRSYLVDCYEFPEKVDYRRVMPSFDRAEFSAPDSMDEFHWAKFNRTILFTKSNDWIYEKEQRSIVRLEDADSIICKDCQFIRSQCLLDREIQLTDLGGSKIQITYPKEYEMHEEMGDESIKREIHRLAYKWDAPPIHLFRVNSLAISGVYFGCKASESTAVANIVNNKSLKLCNNINKMKISDTLYQLDPVKLQLTQHCT